MADSYSPEEHQKASTYKASIDIKTIKTIMGIIDVSTNRGTFLASELSLVGQIYDTLEKGVLSSLEKARKELYSTGQSKPKPQQQVQQGISQGISQGIPQGIVQQQQVIPQDQINELVEQKAQQLFQQFQQQQQAYQAQQQLLQQQAYQAQQYQAQQQYQGNQGQFQGNQGQQFQGNPQGQQQNQLTYQNILAQQVQVPDLPQQLQPMETRNSGPLTLPLELQPIETRETGNKELALPSYESMRNEVAPPVQYINSGQQ